MTVANPPVWVDPTSGTVDLNSGPWTAAAIDAICSDLATLGGTDGNSGIAGRPNLLFNGGMEIAQRVTSPWTADTSWTVDGWRLTISGSSTVSVTPDTSSVDTSGKQSLRLTYTHAAGGGCYISQPLEGWAELRGRKVALSARINCSVAGAAAAIRDSSGTTTGPASTAVGVWTTVTATATVNAATTALSVSILLPSVTCVANIDNVMLIPGGIAAPYVPTHPAEEWRRCKRYYQIIHCSLRNDALITAGTVADVGVTFDEMAATPTATVGGAVSNVNVASVAFTPLSTNSGRFEIVANNVGAAPTYDLDRHVTLQSDPA